MVSTGTDIAALAPGPDECPAEDWLAFLGHRWNALVLWRLADGPKRFSDLEAQLPRISPKVLTDRLGELVRRGLVRRETARTFPQGVTYSLTDKGRGLRDIVGRLYEWAAEADSAES
ncbi:winged helix-turn-helix transcriptional regulator [Hoeflea olei]|uniref:HxlR family transcriptional regulator n=1 Tax=Hoeflea olei TaxID=1480615 RepID=A0A1C1YWY1_9HYPH|nr:helix-turn-helix domain-containing protein [Hoeflea olei]OCW57896.1 HxlR family transcriptional regulator [Hoeflea olei]